GSRRRDSPSARWQRGRTRWRTGVRGPERASFSWLSFSRWRQAYPGLRVVRQVHAGRTGAAARHPVQTVAHLCTDGRGGVTGLHPQIPRAAHRRAGAGISLDARAARAARAALRDRVDVGRRVARLPHDMAVLVEERAGRAADGRDDHRRNLAIVHAHVAGRVALLALVEDVAVLEAGRGAAVEQAHGSGRALGVVGAVLADLFRPRVHAAEAHLGRRAFLPRGAAARQEHVAHRRRRGRALVGRVDASAVRAGVEIQDRPRGPAGAHYDCRGDANPEIPHRSGGYYTREWQRSRSFSPPELRSGGECATPTPNRFVSTRTSTARKTGSGGGRT